MDTLRRIPRKHLPVAETCSLCAEARQRWDRIAGKPYCPNCEEDLVLGIAAPLCERTEPRPCAICARTGTVPYLTFPLGGTSPIEMDLCPEHLRTLLGRCLTPPAFGKLRRRLHTIGLDVEQVFLLHDAFYDPEGQALQPALSVEL